MVTSQSNASLVDLEADSSKESSTFTVSGFDFTVCKGEVLAVCGPVGGGKSSLINGIIDEIPKASSSTKVTQRGSIAYVPQTPFILNATIRANILFGRPFDPELYDRVLDACCLRPDLEQLGASADQTEIGERGVTLSGGACFSLLPVSLVYCWCVRFVLVSAHRFSSLYVLLTCRPETTGFIGQGCIFLS